MKITQVMRDYAATLNISEEDALTRHAREVN
jgi:hypothetical protein